MRGVGWAILYHDPATGGLLNCWTSTGSSARTRTAGHLPAAARAGIGGQPTALLIGPAGRDHGALFEAIGSLLDLRQDLLQEHLSLDDPLGAGPQDLANDIEDDLHLFGVLHGPPLSALRTGSRRPCNPNMSIQEQLRSASPVRRGNVAVSNSLGMAPAGGYASLDYQARQTPEGSGHQARQTPEGSGH